jgi:signal peptidase
LSSVAQGVALVFLLLVVLSSLVGYPMGVSYVTSGSMEPTLDTGDGFVAIPTVLTGSPTEGDVVVFRAEEVNDGRLTTHRVVEETEQGYVTKGDANPFTDQATGEPMVQEVQVVAVAGSVGGQLLVIPELGNLVTGVQRVMETIQLRLAAAFGTGLLLGTQGLAYLVFAGSILVYVVADWREQGSKERTRRTKRSEGVDVRLIMGAFTALLVLGATVAMVAPAGTVTYGVVSSQSDAPGARVIPVGESETTAHAISNSGVLPVHVFLEPASDGIDVRPGRMSVPPGRTVEATVTLSAPPEYGFYRQYLIEHRYLAVLPRAQVDGLHDIHPWLPIVVIDALLGVPFFLLGTTLIGTGRVRRRPTRGVSVETNARRLLSHLWR